MRVAALSPTEAAVQEADDELGRLLATGDRNAIRTMLRNKNDCSVVRLVNDNAVLMVARARKRAGEAWRVGTAPPAFLASP